MKPLAGADELIRIDSHLDGAHERSLAEDVLDRAIELRDRECTHHYCDVPAPSCQVDHIVPFSAGGPTVEENGRLLCAFHNRLRNGRQPPDD